MSGIVRVIIQARMQSSRLPGKILAELAGEPMLAHVVRRLRAAGRGLAAWQVMVATSTDEADDRTERCCDSLGEPCFRGSHDDVLARYVAASADLDEADTLVRATADNPLYCTRRTPRIVWWHQQAKADYTCIRGLSYVVPEVVQVGALRAMATHAKTAECREHVTPWFRREGHAFRVVQLPDDWLGLRPSIRLTVDTPLEMRLMANLFHRFGRDDPLFPVECAYELLEERKAAA